MSYSCPPPVFPNPTPPGCADGTCNPAPPSIPNSCACGDVGSQGPTAPGRSGTPADGALAGAMAAILAVGGGMPGTINTPPGGVSPSSCPSGSSGSCPSGSCGTGTGSGALPAGPAPAGMVSAGGIGGFPAGGNGGFSPSGNGGGGGSSGSCPGSAGVCGVNPAAGNLLLQIGPPSAGGFDPGSLLSYNSLAASSASGAYGAGWTATYNRYIRKLSSTVAQVVDSVGNVFNYTLPGSGTRYTPPQGTNNGLVVTSSGGWIETQPDGLAYLYPAPNSNQIALLQAVQNRAGGLWTMTYDPTGTLLKTITDPSSRLTSFAYNANSQLQSYQDVGGRITTFLVNSSGDLARSPPRPCASPASSIAITCSPCTSTPWAFAPASPTIPAAA